MDVQQGALERHGFKLLYLYNENAALRRYINEFCPDKATKESPDGPEPKNASRAYPLEYALQREHQEIKIFAVCPDKSFVQTTLNTRDIWNTKGARIAFDVMYRTTSELLENYSFDELQKAAHVALIRRAGSYIYDHDF